MPSLFCGGKARCDVSGGCCDLSPHVLFHLKVSAYP
jgi:hypothetical protein